ncbi:hypothetical protein HY450_02805 [Candidatus Pacearchaeota archaeon]|nr:hypothetical protein [Candidatus Pacearchaeota archaeon]
MVQEIISKIKGKKLVLFGEIHGTKEIPELLLNLFSDLAKNECFTLGLEISNEFQNVELDKIISSSKKTGTSGLINKDYINLIKKMPKNVKVFFIAPSEIKNQEEMEKGISDNILKLVDDKRTFVVLGNIHASKNRITIGNFDIAPAGFLIYQRLKGEMYSILLKPKSGEFFNNGIKQVTPNENDSFDKNFDYIYEIDNVSPCSF